METTINLNLVKVYGDYYIDFETTSESTFNKEKRARVWSWVAKDDNNNRWRGTNTNEVINLFLWISKNTERYHTTKIWCYNLSFEGSFIEDYLLENGYKEVLNLKRLKKNEFRVIRNNGHWYGIILGNIILIDGGNFVAGGLEKFAETFAPEVPKYTMTDDWYKKDRPIGYIPKDFEWNYNENDVDSLRIGIPRFFNEMKLLIDEFLGSGSFDKLKLNKKLTISSIAYEVLKASVPNWKFLFPKTTQKDFDYMVGAYTGGYVFARPITPIIPTELKNNIVDDYYVRIYGQDIKSSYPSSYGYEIMPYGLPIKFHNGEIEKVNFKFKIYHVRAKYDLKKGYVPIIGGHRLSYVKTTYNETSKGEYVEFMTTNIDFEFIKKYYDIDYEIIDGMGFHTFDENPFSKYVEFWYKVKERAKLQGNKVMGEIAKLMLNSPYGKTAMNGKRIDILRYYEQGEIKQSNVYSLNKDGYEYLPIAICTASHSHAKLWKGAEQIGWNNVVYADTDSIKSVIPLPILGKNLGDFEHEYIADYFKVLAPKRYNTCIKLNNGKYKIDVKAAGFSKKVLKREFKHCNKNDDRDINDVIESIKKFKAGLEINVEQFKRVKGGRVAFATTKKFI